LLEVTADPRERNADPMQDIADKLAVSRGTIYRALNSPRPSADARSWSTAAGLLEPTDPQKVLDRRIGRLASGRRDVPF
jgi:hypothetical protein